MQGGKTILMHFPGATDYSADVFLTGTAAISRTKQNYYILYTINHQKVAYKAFISVNFGWLEYLLVTFLFTIMQTFSKILPRPLPCPPILQIFYPVHLYYRWQFQGKFYGTVLKSSFLLHPFPLHSTCSLFRL